MQSINVVVLNPTFLGAFIGTAILSLGAVVLAVVGWGRPPAPFLIGGAIFYLVGTFLVTGLGNVPLNDQLAGLSVSDAGAAEMWDRYVARWTAWNHVRTVSSLGAAVLLSLGLLWTS